MKMLSSTKIAIGFILLIAIAWFGYNWYAEQSVMRTVFPGIQPTRVNLVGVETGGNFRIRVANQVAQLVLAKDEAFGAPDSQGDESAPDDAVTKRIPIKELLGSLQGDTKALGRFVMRLNDKADNGENWPIGAVPWEMEDVRKALDGDPALSKKLVKDLNIELDGTPLASLRISALQNGILVRSKVPVRVKVGDEEKLLGAEIETPYRPNMMIATEARYAQLPDVNDNTIAGYYKTEADLILSGKARKENVRAALTRLIDPKALAPLAELPGQILRSAKVVVNDQLIENASFKDYDTSDGEMYDLTIHMTDEGRRRLWQYSRPRLGSQILLIANGVAIAAPRIRSELSQGELQITQMRDKGLVQDAVSTINNKKKAENQ